MKANELMIGDWVYEGNNHPIQVVRNYGRSIMYKEEYSNEVEETCLNPIPLTEEILKANGFIDGEGMAQGAWCCGDFRLSASCFGIFKKLNYVHELQHALRLCGLNELADNFKITHN